MSWRPGSSRLPTMGVRDMGESAVIVRGGRIIDPSQGLDEVSDLLIRHGRVAAIGGEIDAPDTVTIDAAGRLVVPGLIDLHAHAYWGVGRGIDADADSLPHGVTTLVDGGSAGSLNFAGFKRYIVEPARSRIISFIHLSYIGLVGGTPMGELIKDEWADPDGALEILKSEPEIVRGVKLRLEERAVGAKGIEYLEMTRQLCRTAGVPMMVHICGSTDSLRELLPHFDRGDIVTHMMTGRGNAQLLDETGEIIPEAYEARQRGVVFDVAHGRSHFPFRVAEKVIGAGFLPDVISTDVTSLSVTGPVYNLPYIMSKHLALGMELVDVIRATTSRPAEVIGSADDLGTLRPGAEADVAVLELRGVDEEITDTEGATRRLSQRLVATNVIRSGEVV